MRVPAVPLPPETIVPLMDVPRQNASLRAELDAAIADCLDTSEFLQGARVAAFERAYAEFSGARFAVACGNGTDALYLAAKALGAGPGDEVLVPAMTFAATAEAVALAGARPILVDVDEQGLLSLPAARRAVTHRTRGLIFVALYGQLRELDAFSAFARERGLAVIVDAAQAQGATLHGKPAEAYADIVCTSFYPGKNLGACGDAGGCTTDNPALARDMAMRRDHGRSNKYCHELVGVNMRMDELQGSILNAKLRHLPAWTARRRRIAALYRELLGDLAGLKLPTAAPEESVWHLYVVQCERRDALADALAARGIGTGIHYPVPLNRQPAFDVDERCPNAERLAQHALSIPMFETMTDEEVHTVAKAIRSFFAAG